MSGFDPVVITLTRFAGPNWERELPAIKVVERNFTCASPQHPMRKWEYTMGLLAFYAFRERSSYCPHRCWVLDVGGAGSPFARMFPETAYVAIVDPALPASAETIEELAHRLAGGPHRCDALFSISVIEHVPDLDGFLDACTTMLRPGGLLFLTMDAWDPPSDDYAKDTAHFHWMRERIFSVGMIEGLLEALEHRGFTPFGAVDLEYKGNTVYDYTFASLAMIKEG